MKKNFLTILLYHGVTKHENFGIENHSAKHIDANDFVFQMKYIKKNLNILSMDEVAEIYNDNREIPKNSVAITFDDGFENNYTEAAPVLDDLNIPATFYITSGIVNTNIMFWVDQIEDIINYSKIKEISLKLNKDHTFPIIFKKDKLFALSSIKTYCKLASREEKDRVLSDLIDIASYKPNAKNSPNYNKITWCQLKNMNSNNLFTIGGHSLYHDILSSMDSGMMRMDIKLSIKLLEYNLKNKIEHYSYPEGQMEHFNEEVVSCLKNNGIKISPSAIHGVNYLDNRDLFNLRRVMVGIDGKPFPFK